MSQEAEQKRLANIGRIFDAALGIHTAELNATIKEQTDVLKLQKENIDRLEAELESFKEVNEKLSKDNADLKQKIGSKQPVAKKKK